MIEDTMDDVFQALAHGTRRAMLDIIRANPGSRVGHVCEQFDMSRIGAMKHLGILEDAGLLVSRKDGRARCLYVNATPIQMIHERWTTEWSAMWASELLDLKDRVESTPETDRASGAPQDPPVAEAG